MNSIEEILKPVCNENLLDLHRLKIPDNLIQKHNGFNYFCCDSRRETCQFYLSIHNTNYCVLDKHLGIN